MTHRITTTVSKSAIAFIVGMSFAAPLYAADEQIDLNTDLTIGSLEEYAPNNAEVELGLGSVAPGSFGLASLTHPTQTRAPLDFGEPEAMRQMRLNKLGYGYNDRQSLKEFKAKQNEETREFSSDRMFY